jgi:hypothetical protein
VSSSGSRDGPLDMPLRNDEGWYTQSWLTQDLDDLDAQLDLLIAATPMMADDGDLGRQGNCWVLQIRVHGGRMLSGRPGAWLRIGMPGGSQRRES